MANDVRTVDDVLGTHPKDGPFPVGSHDPQNPDGKPRTERAGEILGIPSIDSETAKHLEAGRKVETAKADLVTKAVDNANRFALPRLGGNVDDDWAADQKTLEDAKRIPSDDVKADRK